MARKAARQGTPPRTRADGEAWPVIEEVRQLVELMVENDLGEVDITDGDRKIHLKRGSAVALSALSAAPPFAAAPYAPPAAVPPVAPAPEAAPKPEELIEIKSPMVGTFYSSASPDSEAYISVGAAVEDDSVVCIVEAMKVMNEVRAECSGTIVEVCVRNAQPVEYGQVLFRVRPA
ncbi:MAG TPA: acetyl-CoA carboxylase biotin carboxyl carrier protein [Phycisphaerae bacterium]|nr:acetyl-CoA carboxylase biotin carboxyl carrier protein [Phycisphaerae bacterium]